MCFHASAADETGKAAIDSIAEHKMMFDDDKLTCFAVSIDPRDREQGLLKESLPGFRVFWDFDGSVSKLYGSVPVDAKRGSQVAARRMWVVIDPALHILGVIPFQPDGSDKKRVFDFLKRLPAVGMTPGFEMPVPVIALAGVFEPEFCKTLIEQYEKHGGEESGFMREVDGKTVLVHDHYHKRRRDHLIQDPAIIKQCQARVQRRIVPEIQKVHQFLVTRMERYIVSCYSAADRGHFRPHRDNTTKGTAHRRFAVTINLNDEFEGGELMFPEYGRRTFKAPVGGAVVFSCSLLHTAGEVTKGKRFAFLPFLYDEAASKIREDNNKFLGEGVGEYRA
jgi:predicted 2-oxoglutarate/Fe(II)-dependent dioxygenase YbiX/peroxiredoxin